MLAEFDRLQIEKVYETVEISVLGHYQPSCVQNFQQFVDFILQRRHASITAKSTTRQIIDDACSQRIFLARNCSEWTA